MRLLIGMSGASGAVYGVRMLEVLQPVRPPRGGVVDPSRLEIHPVISIR